MERIKKNFGFGFMRLPMKDGEVDIAETNRMVDAFLDAGFNYFDTAHGYLQGKSEKALQDLPDEPLSARPLHPDGQADGELFQDRGGHPSRCSRASSRPAASIILISTSCTRSARRTIGHFKACRAYETAFALKEEGKVRHVGISFHGRPELLEQILTEYPAIEVVQIQFNYVDYDDPSVQSRKCYEVCRKFNKPVIVMEPVKGGNLVKLPDDARAVLDALHGGSPASYAIRFAAGFPGMLMVLSGMSTPWSRCRTISRS